ncbi:MAG: ribosome small subunit-dependent GTPase A [Oscillospiraceae bacterium]|nr:ribosome small subunit-dependent GTPase A [Oscillospiraceae bacterium]
MTARGVVFKALAGFYYVDVSGQAGEEKVIECRARGRLRLDGTPPLVGDSVDVAATEPGKGVLTDILPRRNAFVRPPVANIDQLVIVVSGAVPVTDPFLIDRMTVAAYAKGCECVICVNKCDMDSADGLFEIYALAGFNTIRTSAGDGRGRGREEIMNAISGKFSAFTGNSGVGKSSILNMLSPALGLATGEVSKKLGRGRHTTRHVELYKLGGGAIVADTPGFSSFDAELAGAMDRSRIQYAFPDFAPYLGECRFGDCLHINEPGCAVKGAVELGAIHPSRHAGYARLCHMAARNPPS